jgi:DNA-binding SARP family transcriptional activator
VQALRNRPRSGRIKLAKTGIGAQDASPGQAGTESARGDIEQGNVIGAETAVNEVHRSMTGEVFELFPYGIAVTGADRRVVASNAAAEKLLGAHVEDSTCCELFGCRHRAPLEAVCLTELAIDAAKPLPELRVDVKAAPAGALWITAASLGADSSRVVFHLRPGDPADRRRRTTPHWTAGPRLRISTLGRTAVESAEGSIGGNWLQHRPGQLLKYLLCERDRMLHADEIAGNLWPGADPGVLNNVRHFVHALREKLEPERVKRQPSSFVVAGRGGYALNRDRIWIDADEFEQKTEAGLAAFARDDDALARRLLAEALAVYRGDFLADEPYAEWAFAERERLRDVAGRALGTLGDIALAAGAEVEAIGHYKRLADMYPFDTAVQRQVIGVHLRIGRRSDAMRRYDELRVRMLREFGAGPEFQLSDLIEDAAAR